MPLHRYHASGRRGRPHSHIARRRRAWGSPWHHHGRRVRSALVGQAEVHEEVAHRLEDGALPHLVELAGARQLAQRLDGDPHDRRDLPLLDGRKSSL